MKKIALTSLIAMFAFAGAHAANVIDGNPLYMPKKGHFYSVTDVSSHTDKYANGDKQINTWKLGEEFGYGVTDKFAVQLSTALSENDTFKQAQWGDLELSGVYRALDKGAWKLDVFGAYDVSPLWNHPKPNGQDAWFDKDLTEYVWSAGVRGGYTTAKWTVAGHAMFSYWNDESFNWNEGAGKAGIHALTLGLDGQYVIDSNWNVTAGVEYTGILDDEYRKTPGTTIKNAGTWEGTFGVNYNIDATKFVGAYISGSMNHQGGTNNDEWKADDGFGFGAKFGIDF